MSERIYISIEKIMDCPEGLLMAEVKHAGEWEQLGQVLEWAMHDDANARALILGAAFLYICETGLDPVELMNNCKKYL